MKVVGYMRVNSIEQLGGTQVAEKEKSMVERYWIRKGLDMPIFIQVTEGIDRSFYFHHTGEYGEFPWQSFL